MMTHPDASQVDRVVAVALDLAFAASDDAPGIARVLDAARDESEVLERARAQLYAVTVGDPATRSRAIDLLDQAMAHLRRSP